MINYPNRSRFCSFVASFALLVLFLVPNAQAAEGDAGGGFDAAIDKVMKPMADVAEAIVFYSVAGFPLILVLLASTAIFLTIYFKFINLRGFKAALGTVRGKYTDPNAPGQITHFQALSAALSATVGLGNIAGVAVAISIGGPGATFWMIIIGLCGMTTKFTECTLGVLYRKVAPDGSTRGGAMYYLSDGLAEKGLAGLGKFLAVFFAIMCIAGAIGAGNMFQANQAHQQVYDSFGIFEQGWQFGAVVAVLVALVIIGGIVAIARVTSFLVPFMCGMYMLAAITVLIVNAANIPGAIVTICVEAFNFSAAGGAVVGAVLIQGIKRGVFSNEAGVGSAPIAHSAVKTNRPASEGLVALLEPFIDTVVVCTMTALVIVTTGMWDVKADSKAADTPVYTEAVDTAATTATLAAGEKLRFTGNTVPAKPVEGEEVTWYEVTSFDDSKEGWVKADAITQRGSAGIWLTSEAFRTVIGWFPYVLSIAVFLFAFSTMISWSYYAEQAVIYLFGDNKAIVIAYKLMFCCFIVVGAAASLGNVIRLADALFFCMVLPNLIGVYLLLPKVKEQLTSYLAHVREVDAKGK